MAPRMLAHHAKTDNMYRFTFGVQTITVTRRFLPSRVVRVRVTAAMPSGTAAGTWSKYRDFPEMRDGDAAFMKQANTYCAMWEERYCSGPARNKETPVTDEPTQEPTRHDRDSQPTATQWEGGATLTPARAAELATRRTGVQHVVGEDGRTLCRPDSAEQPPATIAHPVRRDAPVTLNSKGVRLVADAAPAARILGEYTFRVRGDRPTRTGAMDRLLTGSAVIVSEARTSMVALANTGLTGHPATDEEHARAVMDLQGHSRYFAELLDAGYCPTTRWEELVDMLQPLLAKARQALPEGAREITSGAQSVQELREMVAAALFLRATEGVRYFFEDPEDED